MLFVRIIDNEGFFIVDDFVEEITEFTIETLIPNGMYAVSGITPKWDGTQWLEVVAKPEMPIVTEPTEIEQLRTDVDYISIMTGVDL